MLVYEPIPVVPKGRCLMKRVTSKPQKSVQVNVAVPAVLAAAIDRWRRDDEELPTRPMAVRKILERVLLNSGKAKAAA